MSDRMNKYWLDRGDDFHAQRRKKQRFNRCRIRNLSFEHEMFERRKSYQLLFITLVIKKYVRDDVNFETMQTLRRKLFQRIKDATRGILYDIHGLIWRQESGGSGDENHHLHLVVFVSASRRDHVTACDELGEYWVALTRGWGDYDNSNRYAHSYKNRWGVAVGYLHRDDDEKRESLRKVIGLYMSKVTQAPVDRDEDDKLSGRRKFCAE
ncbi:hypothetical protein GJG85_02195 [Burkholderia sp. MS389]|uniref:hypothetical protein n=1 Tax=Burkholderia sp. MS389 TaxID=2811789 RepID=UPI00195B1CA9|nr:hypothetical protein [Burkholderia sp. MS389]QRR12271.1 hypothetical protein GJG85_02195 [Burkholderia sp. MS389]